MGVSYSPRISTEGLVLLLDPANPKSYPKTGGICYDLSKNENHANLINSPPFSKENKGIFKLENGGFISIPDSASLNLSSGMTIGLWVRFSEENLDYYKTIFGKPSYYYYGLIIEWYGGNGFLADFSSGGSRNPLYYVSPDSTPILNDWIFVMSTYQNNGLQNNQNLYHFSRNGLNFDPDTNRVLVSNTVYGDIDSSQYEDVFIGNGDFSFDVGPCYIYNRGLSYKEVLDIFNSTRGRFGI